MFYHIIWHNINKSDREPAKVLTCISNLKPFRVAVLERKSKISVLTKNDSKYSPKIHNSRYWHEMNKSEREQPKVLGYQIWNHSELRFWRRSQKYQFWPKMTQNIHQKYKIQYIDTKWTNLRENHPRYLHIKFETILSCGSGEEVENVIVDGRQTTADNQ